MWSNLTSFDENQKIIQALWCIFRRLGSSFRMPGSSLGRLRSNFGISGSNFGARVSFWDTQVKSNHIGMHFSGVYEGSGAYFATPKHANSTFWESQAIRDSRFGPFGSLGHALECLGASGLPILYCFWYPYTVRTSQYYYIRLPTVPEYNPEAPENVTQVTRPWIWPIRPDPVSQFYGAQQQLRVGNKEWLNRPTDKHTVLKRRRENRGTAVKISSQVREWQQLVTTVQ